MLAAADLANDMKSALGFGSEPMSSQLLGFATDIVDHLKTGIVANAPGSVLGIAPPSGGPLTNGSASGGTITLVPDDLSSRLVATFGTSTPEITQMATAISLHFSTGFVNFATGNITGTCTNTPTTPGVLTGQGIGGQVIALNGPILASDIASAIGQSSSSSQLDAMAQAIVDYVQNNAEVIYAPGSVTGVCSTGGGPIIGGTATGGTIA